MSAAQTDVLVRREIDAFVKWILQHHDPITGVRGGKVIHDGVWGTNRYEPFEVALINTPLVQRLRQIHQTAFTYFTYPSSRHTRFEHTLGVVTQISKLLSALYNKFEYSGSPKRDLLGEELNRTLRCAALLHDVGHGPASHTSEEIYKQYQEIRDIKREDPWKSANAHEIFAYLILESPTFNEFIVEVKKKCPVALDLEPAKQAVVGHHSAGDSYYKIDMMNGPFDADKLDYLFRDGHFSGLPLHVDLDRLWYALYINYVGDDQ